MVLHTALKHTCPDLTMHVLYRVCIIHMSSYGIAHTTVKYTCHRRRKFIKVFGEGGGAILVCESHS